MQGNKNNVVLIPLHHFKILKPVDCWLNWGGARECILEFPLPQATGGALPLSGSPKVGAVDSNRKCAG